MGFFFENRAKNKANATSFTKNVVDAVADFLDGLGGQIIMISVPRTLTDMQPFIWRKFKVVPHYTYIIDLSIPEESLLGNMSPERRNDIRRALNDGITTERILDYGIILDLVRKSFARQSRAVDSHYLEKILYEFARGENSFAIASFREGLPIAASFCIHDRRTAYYLLGGYDPEHRHHGAGALAVWEAIRHSKSLNLERFDFEGSMVKAVERYFRDFGGDLVPYYRVNKALLPLEILLKFRKRELF
jgi:lipid II:glycine glycyltransferase (peptidoglycan interpeptide bridge formation enzyme)